jgi:hypothetical protein
MSWQPASGRELQLNLRCRKKLGLVLSSGEKKHNPVTVVRLPPTMRCPPMTRPAVEALMLHP